MHAKSSCRTTSTTVAANFSAAIMAAGPNRYIASPNKVNVANIAIVDFQCVKKVKMRGRISGIDILAHLKGFSEFWLIEKISSSGMELWYRSVPARVTFEFFPPHWSEHTSST